MNRYYSPSKAKMEFMLALLIMVLVVIGICAIADKNAPQASGVSEDGGGLPSQAQPETSMAAYGAGANPTGNPIGGGPGYSNIIDDGSAKYVVSTKSQLLSALVNASSGQIIYVEDSAQIDLSGTEKLAIPAGVTIASGRGRDGSLGGMIYQSQLLTGTSYPVWMQTGANVRFTGLRLRGPDPDIGSSGNWAQLWEGINFAGDNCEVDNCEVYQWGMGLCAGHGTTGQYFHHNYIHHNRRIGFGYGIIVANASALIECNSFDYNRHDVCGNRGSDPMPTSYEARYNFSGANTTNSLFDCHGGNDVGKASVAAGGTILIHHNTSINMNRGLVGIRGVPTNVVKCYNNWTYIDWSPKKVYEQLLSSIGLTPYVKMEVYDNWYGTEAPPSTK